MAKGRALLVGDDNQDVTPEDVVKVRVGQGHEKGVDACVGSRGAVGTCMGMSMGCVCVLTPEDMVKVRVRRVS